MANHFLQSFHFWRKATIPKTEHPSDWWNQETATMPGQELLQRLGTDLAGLFEKEALQRLETYGPNRIAEEEVPSWYIQLYHSFRNPFVLLLLFIALVSVFTGDFRVTLIIGVMVLGSVFLRFSQERRSIVAAEKLRALVTITATILRRNPQGQPLVKEIPIREIVPGDIVQLAAGDMIPADVRLVSSKDLFISQAVLTGEAMPVEKYTQIFGEPPVNLLDAPNLCFLGTNVLSGTATAVVFRTGAKTYLGTLARSVMGRRTLTNFDQGVQKISTLIIRVTVVMTLFVFLINGLTKHDWFQSFLFAISVAVGLTPEMLPMIVSGTLALGSLSMSRNKVIVKRLESIQNLGAMDVLCTDKTGTLTQDKVVLVRHCDVLGVEDPAVYYDAYLNSFHQTGLRNLLDRAILEYHATPPAVGTKIDEIPFDFQRRLMSVVMDWQGQRKLIAKGAPPEVLAKCAGYELAGTVHSIQEKSLGELQTQIDKLQHEGFRVLALAYKNVDSKQEIFSTKDENNLILKGYVAFLDPAKETAAPAIAALMGYGISVKVLTGDHETITAKICQEVGLPSTHVVRGSEVESLEDQALLSLLERTTIFARLTPGHKERIIQLLKKQGHVVGYLGDGINDAPALRAADVGISVNNAVDVAKEAADIILLEKSLLVLKDGVIEGRKVFGNILKYIRMGLSSNFGNMFSVLGASMFLPFLPILPLQILIQNLLYDFSQLSIPLDNVDEEILRQPRKWHLGQITRFVLIFGPISSLFDYATFAFMYFVLGANSLANQSLFQTGWFVEGLLSQTLVVHLIRTRKIPFIGSHASWPLISSTVGIVCLGVLIPYVVRDPKIGFIPLPGSYFLFLGITLLSYFLCVQVTKTWFSKRYGYH